jgi:hypothetical protein
MKQGGNRRQSDQGIRQPSRERNLGALADGANQHEERQLM